MKFLLQQGHGMMGLDREFVGKNLASGVILSPRVHKTEQIERHAKEIKDLGGELLFDPQFYRPHTEREKLLEFPYWENLDFNTATFDETSAISLCERCVEYQISTLEVSRILIPGRYSNSIDDSWSEMHHNFAKAAHSLNTGIPIYSTIALGPDAISNYEVFNGVLDEITAYPVDGIYFVFRHPQDGFLIKDEDFMYSLLDGLLSIRLSGKDIILGYSNQQSLMFAASGIKTIASGNFRNTRAFNDEMFDIQEDIKMRGIWYYDANTLSEFRISTLRLAFRRGFGSYFGPVCEYCQPLLSPDTVSARWPEPLPFKHFLYELRRQWLDLGAETQSATMNKVTNLINTADSNLARLSSKGIHLDDRAFEQSLAPTLSALQAFAVDREADLQRL